MSRKRFEERPVTVTVKVPGTGTVLGTTLTVTVYGDPATATPLSPPASTSAAAPVTSCRRPIAVRALYFGPPRSLPLQRPPAGSAASWKSWPPKREVPEPRQAVRLQDLSERTLARPPLRQCYAYELRIGARLPHAVPSSEAPWSLSQPKCPQPLIRVIPVTGRSSAPLPSAPSVVFAGFQ